MTRFVSVHPLAREEVNEAATYYSLRSPVLAASLVEAFDRAVADLADFPEIGAPVRGDLRRKVLRRFPYSVLYRVLANEVRILVFMHHHRRPSYWHHRA